VSWLPLVAGAAMAWCEKSFKEPSLIPVLDRDIFEDPKSSIASAAKALGLAHRKLHFNEANLTPLGAVIAAPLAGTMELFCRNGLKYYARIRPRDIQAALGEIKKQLGVLKRTRHDKSISPNGKILVHELELAARMAEQSCKFMLWQQALVSGKTSLAQRMSKTGIKELMQLDRDFNSFWPCRNKGATKNSSPFLKWRIADYRKSNKESFGELPKNSR
jgi:hypothetical protein